MHTLAASPATSRTSAPSPLRVDRLTARRGLLPSLPTALLLCTLALDAGAQRSSGFPDSALFALRGRPLAEVDRSLRAAGFQTAGDPEQYFRTTGSASETIHISFDRRRVYALTHTMSCESRATCEQLFERRRAALRRRLGVAPDEREPTMSLWYNVRGWSYLVDAPRAGTPILVTAVSPGF